MTNQPIKSLLFVNISVSDLSDRRIHTFFAETSSSLIDLLLVNNNEHLILSAVGDSFLHQEIRYRCPVFGIFNSHKHKCLSFNVAWEKMMMVTMKC